MKSNPELTSSAVTYTVFNNWDTTCSPHNPPCKGSWVSGSLHDWDTPCAMAHQMTPNRPYFPRSQVNQFCAYPSTFYTRGTCSRLNQPAFSSDQTEQKAFSPRRSPITRSITTKNCPYGSATIEKMMCLPQHLDRADRIKHVVCHVRFRVLDLCTNCRRMGC